MEEQMNERGSDMTPAEAHRHMSHGIALAITFPFVFVWGAVLWDQPSSLPVVLAVGVTYAVVFAIVHLWRRR